MTLFFEVIIIALFMTLFCATPLYFSAARKYSKHLFLIGTGAMFGICFFDLVPEVFELGGSSSLYIMGTVWLIYSAIHLLHLRHHEHEQGSGMTLFLGSLVTHCFASGMLLTVSFGLSKKVASSVFAALLAHKIYESLLLSSILLEQRRSSLWKGMTIAVYALALPVGAGVMALFQNAINAQVAILISSIAVGTLLGCLIFDFLLPSFTQLKHQHFKKAGWILIGLFLTQIIMRQV